MDTAVRAAAYLEGLESRRVGPAGKDVAQLAGLDEPLPAGPTNPAEVLRVLDEIGSPATAASAGGRYFGFVTGATMANFTGLAACGRTACRP